MTSYYNEIDPYAAQWLRNLISAGHIAPGDVDERSITDVRPDDLKGYIQCHFFAGIGGWSYAARLAGWPDDRPLWTGSCPCQPFSAAGKRQGEADERHLWPVFAALILKCRPPVVAGEQVASTDGLGWLDGVCADLEAADYAVWAADYCAAGLGAPHIRQRLWWLADADDTGCGRKQEARIYERRAASSSGEPTQGDADRTFRDDADRCGADGRMGHASGQGLSVRKRAQLSGKDGDAEGGAIEQSSRAFWSDADWIPCRDGKTRPVEPGTFPLADGIFNRVGRLRAYGNAIVPQVAAEILKAYLR